MTALGHAPANLRRRKCLGAAFHVLFVFSTLLGMAMLGLLLWEVSRQGFGWLSWDFLNSFPSRFPKKAGIKSALFGTLWFISLTALFAVPVGIGAAIYLEEYARKGRVANLIEVNIANLAGVPSIVYGMLGLALFVRGLGFGRSVLSGALTMTLLVLPIIIIAAREALRAVPDSIRLAAYAIGATRWQTIRSHVLPVALPGIMTGVILAVSRAMGEAAPLIMIGALTYVAFVPEGPMDAFTVLPIQIFNWTSRPQKDFQNVAAAGIIVLLAVLLVLNAAAVFLRHRFEKRRLW